MTLSQTCRIIQKTKAPEEPSEIGWAGNNVPNELQYRLRVRWLNNRTKPSDFKYMLEGVWTGRGSSWGYNG